MSISADATSNEDPRLELVVKNPDEWKVYQDKAKRDVVFARYAYVGGQETDPELQEIADRLPKEYQMILCTDYLDDTKEHMYKAAVFVNHKTKEVIFANAGTRFGLTMAGAHDIYNDAYLVMEQMPPKLESAGILNQMILDSLGSAASEYKFHYTGHSLGAALSDMAAADMAIRCRQTGITLQTEGEQKISTMTFENPGAQQVIRKMYKANGMDPNEYGKDVDYRGINNKKNLINQTTAHAGKMWEMVIGGDIIEQDLAQTFAQYLALKLEKILPIISRIIEVLSFGNIGKQMDSHKLTHFDNVLCQNAGGTIRDADIVKRDNAYLIEVLTRCKKVVFEEGIFSFLAAKKTKIGDVGKQEYVMQDDKGQIVTSSVYELKEAVAVVKPVSLPTSYTEKFSSKREIIDPVLGIKIPITPTVNEVIASQKGISF